MLSIRGVVSPLRDSWLQVLPGRRYLTFPLLDWSTLEWSNDVSQHRVCRQGARRTGGRGVRHASFNDLSIV